MDSRRIGLLRTLRLQQDLEDEECADAITDLILLAAAGEPSPESLSLKDIYDAISRYESAEYLEPLDVLSALLPCPHEGAMDLIRLCAKNGSVKEVLIVVQEEIERLQTSLIDDEGDESDESDGDYDDSDLVLMQGAIGIIALCSPAISRLKPGKLSALEICSPILDCVTSLIPAVSSFVTNEQRRMLITEATSMVEVLSSWASQVYESDASELRTIKRLLRELLDAAVESCVESVQMSLAVRAARIHFPRYFPPSVQENATEQDDSAMRSVELALESLGDTPQTTPWETRTFSDLIYLAHSTDPLPVSPSSLLDLHRLLIRALQANKFIDEALSLLFGIVADKKTSIPEEILASLSTIFTALASTHLDATIRQLNLLLLSLTSARLPPAPRLEMLLRLTTCEEFPQIRGPAIGLVKEAVLEALVLPVGHAPQNPFGSPELLRVFGGVLFRPTPPEFFSETKTRDELAQSLELLRIADCLSFYYVLLQRDHENKTEVRSKSHVASVQSSILRPLRLFLGQHLAGEEPPLMAILALQIGLDRIDGALRTLDLDQDG